MKNVIFILAVVVLTGTALSFRRAQQEDLWNVPEKYEKLKNPVPPDEASVASGKELYNYFCLSCHGNDGKGSGNKALKFNKKPTDFTTDDFQKHSDGALLYRIYNGHKEMPGFQKKIPGNKDAMEGSFGKTRIPGDIINYLRTFGKNHVTASRP